MSAITSRIAPRYTLAYGSLTGSGDPRTWRVSRRTFHGAPVPRLAPRGWHSDPASLAASAWGDVTENGYYSRDYAILCAGEVLRDYDATTRAIATARRTRGAIYTGPDALAFYTGSDQTVCVGASRAGEPTQWERRTATYRTRDGITYTVDTLAEYVAPDDARPVR
ncbi:hypothetical protein SEA_BRAXOADDIE_88 [Rhodococcus phage Braxoaddie]|nr:hypothetical protein SEA_BRAXOADDIE_88 [Rhodococcus phage Braxoaddie]